MFLQLEDILGEPSILWDSCVLYFSPCYSSFLQFQFLSFFVFMFLHFNFHILLSLPLSLNFCVLICHRLQVSLRRSQFLGKLVLDSV